MIFNSSMSKFKKRKESSRKNRFKYPT
jgi:hypothetical protein